MRKRLLVVLSVCALAICLLGCGDTPGITSPTGVSGINRILSPMYFEVLVSPLMDTYPLNVHPVLDAQLLALDSTGAQDRIRIDTFRYPLEWYMEDESGDLACKFYNQKGSTKQLVCNAPSATPYRACVKTVIDARPIHGCIDLRFQHSS